LLVETRGDDIKKTPPHFYSFFDATTSYPAGNLSTKDVISPMLGSKTRPTGQRLNIKRCCLALLGWALFQSIDPNSDNA